MKVTRYNNGVFVPIAIILESEDDLKELLEDLNKLNWNKTWTITDQIIGRLNEEGNV